MRHLIPTILALFILISCHKEDPKPASLVGKWQITKAESLITVNGKSPVDYLVSLGMSQADAQKEVDDLKSDFSFGGVQGTYEFTSDEKWTSTLTADDDTETFSGTWKLSDDRKTITLNYDDATSDPPSIANIVTFTETELQFDIPLDPGDDDVDYGPLEFFLSLSFKKI